VKTLRNPAFLTVATTLVVLLLYFSLVADQTYSLLRGDWIARIIGIGAIALPLVGVLWVIHNWRLGTAVQRMARVLEREGRVPIHDGETQPDGQLTDSAAEAVFEVARRGVEDRPEDWRAWFHVAYAYAATADRPMARRALRHAARLFRADDESR
jgi:cytochrome c-type biogenesis protein CcmH/NrfG